MYLIASACLYINLRQPNRDAGLFKSFSVDELDLTDYMTATTFLQHSLLVAFTGLLPVSNVLPK